MKKFLSVAALAVPAVSFACGDLSSYRVDGLEFKELPANQAIELTLKAAPYQVVYVGDPPTRLVSATGVTGTLEEVLPDLMNEIGLVYAKAGCTLTFTPRENRHFALAVGDMVDERLGEWLRKNGYTLYWEAGKWRSGGSISLDKTPEETLKDVVSFMRANGANISVEIFQNRAVRVVEDK